MPNVIWGCIVLLICLAGFVYTWRLTQAQHYGLALSCIMLCGLILRIYMAADCHLHEWDERYHALVAKHLSEDLLRPTLYAQPLLDYDYRVWTSNHIWLHKQPLALWLMALCIKLFGLQAFVVRIPAILLSTIAIKLIYDIARSWFDARIAIIAAFLLSINGLIIELAAGRTATDAVDVVFLFFVLLSVWMAARAARSGWLVDHLILGIAIGLAMVTKWLPALITIPVWALLAYPSAKLEWPKWLANMVCIILAASAVALPWQLYVLEAFPKEARWEYAYNSRHFFQALEGQGGDFFYYFDRLRVQYGELIYLPVVWFTWQALKVRRAHDLALLAWFWLPYLFFSIAATKMQAYTLIAAPAVFIINAAAFIKLHEIIKQKEKYKYVLMAVWVGLLALPVRYTIERLKPFTIVDRDPDWHQAIISLQNAPINQPKTVLFNCQRPIETMFFTDCTAYGHSIDSMTHEKLAGQGYTVLPCPGH